jgi:RimJ/RimL family protein N-acetyltransferase
MWDGLTRQLDGELVTLEPLSHDHHDALWTAAQHKEIWAWLYPAGRSAELFDAWFAEALANTASGQEGAFATVERASGKAIGSTRFLALRPDHRGLEIGWTWLTPSAWQTGANIEAKLLMLEHAFERLGCIRVEFKTDSRNDRSRAALAALPAQFEGIFRKHMVTLDVGVRDSAYYSITDDDWPDVRSNLKTRLAERVGNAPSGPSSAMPPANDAGSAPSP